jgi:uncharacterized protein YjbJ (UPF0337 family)
MANWDQAEGKVKEKTGELTDDESLENEGKAQGAFGDVKEKVEDAKDEVEERI